MVDAHHWQPPRPRHESHHGCPAVGAGAPQRTMAHHPIVVLEYSGERYLLAPGGRTDWARNLHAAGRGRLIQHGRVEQFTAVEVPPQQRPPLIEAYRQRYGKMPTVAASFQQLPDPADHPTFRITPLHHG